MRTVQRIPKLHGVPVLVRAALNVPVENGTVTNSFRLRQALPTIEFLMRKGARVILCGHLGDKGTESLAPVYEALSQFIPHLQFSPTAIGKEAREKVRALGPGGVLLLENLRRYKGEKDNDPDFARELASLADVFVEDSFDVCHRRHASVVGVPELLPSYAGFLVEKEVMELTKALKPKRPALAVIAGAKFSTKEPVILSLLSRYDHVFIGGALANDFILAQGNAVGRSLTSDPDPLAIKKLLSIPELMTPRDVVVAAPDAADGKGDAVFIADIPKDKAVLDVGPASIEALSPYIKKAKTVLWNGTLGRYENGFIGSTEALARSILASKARSIVGGGDTVAALEELGLLNRFSFVSTGGGAMLDFLSQGTLPGIAALDEKRRAGNATAPDEPDAVAWL